LSAVTDAFSRLTSMTENALYSALEPDEGAAAEAEVLSVTIKEELQ